MNPRTTYTSAFYDFSRGVEGTQEGAPLWTEPRGKWASVRQGRARIPCFRGIGQTMLVLRVPFRKNGGGMHLNQYTVTLQVRLAELSFRGLLSTGGWDQWSKVALPCAPSMRPNVSGSRAPAAFVNLPTSVHPILDRSAQLHCYTSSSQYFIPQLT